MLWAQAESNYLCFLSNHSRYMLQVKGEGNFDMQETAMYRIGLLFSGCVILAAQPMIGLGVEATLFDNVRVFDGERVINRVDVLVSDGKIQAIGDKLESQVKVLRVDGQGKTLLPGLFDAHVHMKDGDDLALGAFFGITQKLDMGGQPHYVDLFQREQAAGLAKQRADVLGAGYAVTIVGGHGTQFGFEVPTLDAIAGAQSFVDRRIAEGSDYIKIAYGGGDRPVMSKSMLQAAVAAAHARKKMAIAHIDTREQAVEAIQCGIDGLAHLCGDEILSESDVALAKREEVFVIPTTVVMQGFTAANSTKRLVADPFFKDLLSPSSRHFLTSAFQLPPSYVDYEKLKTNIGRLHQNGVPILAGSDAPNPGTAYGVSLHHELELLVECGLTPAEALAAATSQPARIFGLADSGRIQVGRRANLLLVEGNPLTDIKETRRIVGVWKDGLQIDRAVTMKRIAAERREHSQQAEQEIRLISNFDKEIRSEFGAGWSVIADKGSSTKMKLSQDGANGSPKSLRVFGKVRTGSNAYAGVGFSPGAAQVFPADLSAHQRLTFWVKGPPATHSVMIFAQGLPASRATKKFKTTTQWRQITLKISDFKGCDGKGVLAFWFGSHREGAFEFWLDEVALLK